MGSKATRLPQLRQITGIEPQLEQFLRDVKEKLEVYEGLRGDPLDAFLTLREFYKRIGTDETVVTTITAVTDHGGLLGLADDDHPQYLNLSRADDWLDGKNNLFRDGGDDAVDDRSIGNLTEKAFSIITNSLVRLFISSGGLIGVHTPSPNSRLSINCDLSLQRISITDDYVTNEDTIIGCNHNDEIVLKLSDSDCVEGRIICVKDESGQASTNNISVRAETLARKIDNKEQLLIDTDFGTAILYSTGFTWHVLSGHGFTMSNVTNWLTGWNHRKLIKINGAANAGTNYQILIKVGESSGASDYDVHVEGNSLLFPSDKGESGDLRFTKNDGDTLQSIWTEKVLGSSPNRTAHIWIEVEDNLDDDVELYLYYGNNGASNVSSGDDTFLFFDDFDDPTLDSSKWVETEDGGIITITNSKIKLEGG